MSEDNRSAEADAENVRGEGLLTTYFLIGDQLRPVTYTVVDGLAVAEGCLILGTAEDAAKALQEVVDQPGLLRPGAHTQGSAILGGQFRWPDGRVPFAGELKDDPRVTGAIAHWEANTRVRFEARTNQTDFVEFVSGSGCKSFVGKQGGSQLLTLGPDCTMGNCIHEIGHCLGLFHEQSRIDRDAHVQVLWENIQANTEANFFQRLNDSQDVGGYDFGSIMHYGLTAFSKNGQPTMRTLTNPPPGTVIGQRSALSQGDRTAIATLYP